MVIGYTIANSGELLCLFVLTDVNHSKPMLVSIDAMVVVVVAVY